MRREHETLDFHEYHHPNRDVILVGVDAHEVKSRDQQHRQEERWEHARQLLTDHHSTVSDVLSWDDPLPALGVLYPLMVFLKHGKVSMELLVS